MPGILRESRRPLDGTQRDLLTKFFESPTFNLLREVIAANTAIHQLEMVNKALYPDNEAMQDTSDGARAKAVRWNCALEVLDELAKADQKLFTATIDLKP